MVMIYLAKEYLSPSAEANYIGISASYLGNSKSACFDYFHTLQLNLSKLNECYWVQIAHGMVSLQNGYPYFQLSIMSKSTITETELEKNGS